MVGDCRTALLHLLDADPTRTALLDAGREARVQWLSAIKAGPRCEREQDCASDEVPLHPARVVRELRRAMPSETILAIDGGTHAFFAAHYWQTHAPRQHYFALGLGAMGWALPASIGIQLARPRERTVVVTGDGCMMMHGVEIQTAVRYKVPVIWVVFNNGALGAVYTRMKRLAPEAAPLVELPTYDWVGFARAFGAQGVTVETPDQLPGAFQAALDAHAPFVIDVRCSRDYTAPAGPWAEAEIEWNAHH